MRKLSMEELGRKSVEDFKLADKKPLVVVMDNIRSMHNVGSVFRTADAFLLEGIGGNEALVQRDGIHPTAEAQPIIVKNVLPELEKILP